MKLNRQQIHEQAMKVLEAHPNGIRWVDLLRSVEAVAPDTPHNSIHGGVHNLLTTRTSEIVKVARGTYQLAKFVAEDGAVPKAVGATLPNIGISAQSPKCNCCSPL